MKIGIDSYCYHRLFGEVYKGQDAPASVLTFEDFLVKVETLGIDGVSLESCFIPKFDKAYLQAVKKKLDTAGLDRVYAWGHPDGLEGGKNKEAFNDMIKHIDYAQEIGAPVMRVVGSSLMFRFEPHGPQIKTLIEMFTEAAKVAERKNVKIAVENHIDFNSDEILQIIQGVNRPNMGVNFDSGNFLRVLDDPFQAMQKLAPYVFATHIKDLRPVKGVPVTEWYFFSCVPTGKGLIENEKLAQLLKKNDYEGFLAVEIDFLHPEYTNREEEVVKDSIKALRVIGNAL